MLIKTFMATCIAATALWAPVSSLAAGTVWVRQAPPEAQVEQMPPARHGYQWVPGYWNWHGGQHVWTAGTWVRERQGYMYAQPTWVEDNGRWRLQRGQWSRHDRDGIPNKMDRDRDGDGVRNGQDRRPDDPKRP